MFARTLIATIISAAVSGCSGIQFSKTDNGHSHPYRVAQPALKVVTAPDCAMTAEVISIPGERRFVSFRNGIGKADVSIQFEPGGTIKQINSKTEGVVDDIVKVASTVAGIAKPGLAPTVQKSCPASVQIYAIEVDNQNGQVKVNPTPMFPVP